MIMEIKTHPPMKVLCSTHQTTIPQLGEFVGTVAQQLYADAVAAGVLVSGTQQWIYYGMDGKNETVFTLEIALPIQGEIASSRFSVKELPAFTALSHLHEGAWQKMPQTYTAMLQYVEQHKISLTNQSRELYHNVDFAHAENNRVEILMGIV
jgi:effector-binding domain-containing protein